MTAEGCGDAERASRRDERLEARQRLASTWPSESNRASSPDRGDDEERRCPQCGQAGECRLAVSTDSLVRRRARRLVDLVEAVIAASSSAELVDAHEVGASPRPLSPTTRRLAVEELRAQRTERCRGRQSAVVGMKPVMAGAGFGPVAVSIANDAAGAGFGDVELERPLPGGSRRTARLAGVREPLSDRLDRTATDSSRGSAAAADRRRQQSARRRRMKQCDAKRRRRG